MSLSARRFLRNGVAFHYLAGGQGPTLVFLHGGGSRASQFTGLMERLANRFQVFAYDQRGFGDTGCPPDAEISHDVWAEDALAFIAEIGAERAGLVGWSMGATVALNAASRAPTRISGLALMGAPDPDKPINHAFFEKRLAMFQAGRPPEAVVSEILEQSAAMFGRAAAAKRPNLLDVVRAEQLAAAPCAAKVTAAYRGRPPLGPIIEKVACPVTLIVGDEDRTCDLAGARVLQSRLKTCDLAVVPDCGHYYALEQPRAVAELIADVFA